MSKLIPVTVYEDDGLTIAQRRQHKITQLRALVTLAAKVPEMHAIARSLAMIGHEADAYALDCMADRVIEAIDSIEMPRVGG